MLIRYKKYTLRYFSLHFAWLFQFHAVLFIYFTSLQREILHSSFFTLHWVKSWTITTYFYSFCIEVHYILPGSFNFLDDIYSTWKSTSYFQLWNLTKFIYSGAVLKYILRHLCIYFTRQFKLYDNIWRIEFLAVVAVVLKHLSSGLEDHSPRLDIGPHKQMPDSLDWPPPIWRFTPEPLRTACSAPSRSRCTPTTTNPDMERTQVLFADDTTIINRATNISENLFWEEINNLAALHREQPAAHKQQNQRAYFRKVEAKTHAPV